MPIGAKNGPTVKRDWSAANAHHRPDGYGCCIVCGKPGAELAHLAGRIHDFTPALGYEEVPLVRSNLFVAPTRVALLCGPATDPKTCHAKQEARRLEILGLLSIEQQLQLVADLGGISPAFYATTEETP